MDWRDPYKEYPEQYRWILLLDENRHLRNGERVKTFFVTSPSDRTAAAHVPLSNWPFEFSNYIYMEEFIKEMRR